MSAQQSGEEGPVVEEHVVGGLAGVSGAAPGKDYREKSASTVVRVLTVFAYLFSVSFAAILLSVYYICIWRSPELIEAQGQASARRADDFRPTFTGDNVTFNFTGRSNTEVNESIAEPTIENIQSAIPINATDLLPSSEDWLFNSTAITMQDNSTSYEMEEPLHITNVT